MKPENKGRSIECFEREIEELKGQVKSYQVAVDLLKDQLRRRNLQIKDLKKRIQDLTPRQEFNNLFSDLDECDLEEIADQIKETFTQGRLDNEKRHIWWDLRVNIWND